MMDKSIFFIAGAGRSGTHFLGNILTTSDEIQVDFEVAPVFEWITRAAIQKPQGNVLMEKIASFCQAKASNLATKHYVNKSHPSLWLAEDLVDILSSVRFLYSSRNAYSVVASSLKHRAVRKRVRETPSELCYFLGVVHNDIKNKYDKMSDVQKLTLKWLSHESEAKRLQNVLGFQRFIILKYENLVLNLEGEIKGKLSTIFDVEDLRAIEVKKESLEKYKEVLTSNQLREIDETITDFSKYFGNNFK